MASMTATTKVWWLKRALLLNLPGCLVSLPAFFVHVHGNLLLLKMDKIICIGIKAPIFPEPVFPRNFICFISPPFIKANLNYLF
jgi:hypothetical protein